MPHSGRGTASRGLGGGLLDDQPIFSAAFDVTFDKLIN